MHQRQHGQQGDYPLLSSNEESHAVLCAGQESLTQERHEAGEVGPEESHEDDQRAGGSLLWRTTEGTGVLQPGEVKALRGSIGAFQHLTGTYKKAGESYNGM